MSTRREQRTGDVEVVTYSQPTVRSEMGWSVPRSTAFTSQGAQEYQGHSGTQFDRRLSAPQSASHGNTARKVSSVLTPIAVRRATA